MSKFYVEPDAADEPTIWEDMQGHAAAVVVRRAELPGPHADLLWRVLTGVLCADDETVERMARASWPGTPPSWEDTAEANRRVYRKQTCAVLAALRDAE